MANRDEPFDLSEVRYVKRIVIGTSDPNKLENENFIEQQTQLLNRCLNDLPRGHIIGQEKNFQIMRIGEHQVVVQNIVYHIGFKRKPHWLQNE
jgi:hypothetical protein